MQFINLPKFVIAMTVIIGIFVLMGINAIDADAGLPIITGVMGVGIGNGIALKQGQEVTPIIGAANAPDVTRTDAGPALGGFAILALEDLGAGLIAVEGVDGHGRIVSAVVPFRQTTPAGLQAALLVSWQRWADGRFDVCCALWSWEQEGWDLDAVDDADTGLLPA